MWNKGNFCALLVGMSIGVAIMKNTTEISQNLKTELPYNPSLLLIRKDICNPMFLAAIFTIAYMNQPKCPSIDEQTNVVCVYNRILLSNKK